MEKIPLYDAEKRPNMWAFTDEISKDVIKRDWEAISDKEKTFEAKGYIKEESMSDEFEFCLIEAINKKGFAFDSFDTLKSCRYDDYYRGLDLILQPSDKDFQDGLLLGIDLTANEDEYLPKSEKMIDNLLHRKINIKYFINSDGEKVPHASYIPIALAVPENLAQDFCSLWTDVSETNKYTDKLLDHSIKNILITQALEQLNNYLYKNQEISKALKEYGLYDQALILYQKLSRITNEKEESKNFSPLN